MQTDTLQFKTNINCASCVATVTPVLNEVAGEGKWSVDTTQREKILTVEIDVGAEKISRALEKVGYTAVEVEGIAK